MLVVNQYLYVSHKFTRGYFTHHWLSVIFPGITSFSWVSFTAVGATPILPLCFLALDAMYVHVSHVCVLCCALLRVSTARASCREHVMMGSSHMTCGIFNKGAGCGLQLSKMDA